MEFSFSNRQNLLRDQIRQFVELEIPRELARDLDRRDEFPRDLLRKLAGLGITSVNIPVEYGGQGGDVIDTMIIYEEISRRLPVLAWTLGNIMLYGNEIISINGSSEQKNRFLPGLARGELMFSFALTEPDAGSDAANIKTRAVYRDGYYYISGSKMFITGAGVADYAITFTRTGQSRYGGITSFIVNTRSEGYSARPIKKLGYHGSNTCEVYYDNVKVSPGDILGGEDGLDKGWQQEMKLLNQERLVLSSCALGIGQAALEDALSFAREHFKFRQSGDRFQSVQHRLVEMATELEAARQLAYHAAWKEIQGIECIKETSMAKYFSSEIAKKVVVQGMNIMGAYGSLMEFDMQRYFRDVPILSIGGGTTQIQKNIIGKKLGL